MVLSDAVSIVSSSNVDINQLIRIFTEPISKYILSSDLVSPLFSIVIALLTVGTTLYLQEKRKTTHSLLAVKTEAESNREMTADALLKLSLDVIDEEPGHLTPSSLSTGSYIVARNNGTLATLSDGTKKLLSEHYVRIDITNDEINKISQLWLEDRTKSTNKAEQTRNALLTTEKRTVEYLLMLFDDTSHDQIQDVEEYIRHMNENVIGTFEYNYEGVIDALEEEIKDVRFSFLFR